MRPEDEIRLRHMLDAAREALVFAEGLEYGAFEKNREKILVLAKEIEIIGEAANKVSEPVRSTIGEIPWVDIIGMRHRLVHAYFEIDPEILWKTVQEALPPLIETLATVLREKTRT